MTSKPSLVDQARRQPFFFWFVLLVCGVYAGYFAFTVYAVARHYGFEKAPGWREAQKTVGSGWYVSDVDESGPAAGHVQRGDRLLAINGDERYAVIGYFDWSFVEGGKKYRVDLERRGKRVSFELPMPLVPGQRLTPILALVGLAFFICGAALALLRPEDGQVRLAGLFLMSVGFASLYQTLQATFSFLIGWERIVHYGQLPLALWALPLAYHFFSRFPLGRSPGPLWRTIQWLLYALFVLLIWPALMTIYLGFGISEGATRFMFARPTLYQTACYVMTTGVYIYVVICFVPALVVTIRNYHRLHDRDSRRRIQWVVLGVTVAIVPLVGLTVAANVAEWMRPQTYSLYYPLGFLMMLCIPASIATAVWKQQLFDVRVLIRRGLQHLFARTALRILLALPIAGLIWTIIANRNLPLTAILTGNPLLLVLIAAAGLSLKFRRQLTHWIDRRFFREAYNQEQILLNLIEQIKELDSMPELSRLVSKEVEAAMHPERLYVFYRGEEKRDLTLGYSSGGQSHKLRIAEESELLRLMERQRGAQDFQLVSESGLPEVESVWLTQLGVNLIVPMSGADGRLAGLLLLGEKKSEEPYTPDDRQLLQTIAAQMAVVYENVWLKEQAAKEQKIKHEVLARFEEQQINLVKECPACGVCYDSTSEVCAKDQRELTLSLPVERTIDGKYRLERMIGRGGMGAVYEATDLRLNRQIAIKIMLGAMFGDRTALRRFEREAQASARLNHPNIISVYDYGGIRTDGAYLVMELAPGSTLRSELTRAGLLDPNTTAAWFTQLLEGVKTAHQAGVIHRDLKPENVLISGLAGHERIQVLDFGLAKIRTLDPSNPQSLTAPGTVMGTFGYMSPEQVSGEEVDERSDIFSLGVMVVEALTGRRPFVGRTSAELIAAILHAPFHLTGDAAEAVRLDEALQRCLAKNRERRFGSVEAMQQELIPAIKYCPPVAPAVASSNTTMRSEDGTKTLPVT